MIVELLQLDQKFIAFGGHDSKTEILNSCDAYCRKSDSWFGIQ